MLLGSISGVVSINTNCIMKMVSEEIHLGGLYAMDAKTFHRICLSILQPYPSLISAKGKYMSNDVSHAASSSLCSLLQSFFHLLILIY